MVRATCAARFNTPAHGGKRAYLFFGELQNLPRWDSQLKSLVDNSAVRVVVTGSSALRMELGRDSLAGRINTIESGVLSLTESGSLRGMDAPGSFLEENGLASWCPRIFGRSCGAMGGSIGNSGTKHSVNFRPEAAIRLCTGRRIRIFTVCRII